MPDSFDYTTGTNSENVRLLQALIDDAPEYTEETNSRNANILKSIINNTEYTDAPQSEIEELLLRLKAKIGGEIEVDELNVTENGTYDAGVNKAYNPVKVELPLSSKTITENGTYTASDDNLAGYDEVTVAVEGYAKKSISPAPTAIATFNASALPMPSLTVGIEAVQSGSGDPSPTNIRPFTGFSEVNVPRCGVNFWSGGDVSGTEYKAVRIPIHKGTYNISAVVTSSDTDGTQSLVSFVYVDGGRTSIRLDRTTRSNSSVTLEKDVTEVRFYAGYNSSQSQGDTFTYADIQLEKGTTATTYTAYSGTTYTTTLKDGQGNPLTCYGGELSNENGVQSLDDGYDCFELYEGWNWVASSTYLGAFYIADISTSHSLKPNTPVLCSHAKNVNDLSDYVYGTILHNTAINIRIMPETATLQDFKDYIVAQRQNGTPIKVRVQRGTPQTIPQDNLAIATQDGTNNLWADSGDVLEGSYFKSLN